MRSLLKHRIFILLAGIATAGVIVFSQLFYFQAATYCQNKVETEQQDQKAGTEETYISIPSSTISSTSHIEINQDISFVREILFEDESEVEAPAKISLPVNRFFQTLFRFIVSPNAP